MAASSVMNMVSLFDERERILDMDKDYAKNYRQERLAKGLCGFCGQKRNHYKWLCDVCAARHRERQRMKSIYRQACKFPPLFSHMQYLVRRDDPQRDALIAGMLAGHSFQRLATPSFFDMPVPVLCKSCPACAKSHFLLLRWISDEGYTHEGQCPESAAFFRVNLGPDYFCARQVSFPPKLAQSST